MQKVNGSSGTAPRSDCKPWTALRESAYSKALVEGNHRIKCFTECEYICIKN